MQYTISLPLYAMEENAVIEVEKGLTRLGLEYSRGRTFGVPSLVTDTDETTIKSLPHYTKKGITLDISSGTGGLGNRVFFGITTGTRASQTVEISSSSGIKLLPLVGLAVAGYAAMVMMRRS